MPFGYSAIGGLLGQMEEAKRRMQQPLSPPPDAFQLPRQGGPSAPPDSLLAPTAPSHGIPAATDPFANIANANISDTNDPTHGHRRGLRGGLLHALGADKVAPEVAALLTPDQVERVKPGVIGSLWNAINYGVGPQTVMQARAENMIGLTDKKTAHDKSAELALLQAAWTPVIFAARTPEEIHKVQTGYANARAAILGPEAMGTTPNFLAAIKPTAIDANTVVMSPGQSLRDKGTGREIVSLPSNAPAVPGSAKWFKLPDGTIRAFLPSEQPPKGSMDLETGRTFITVGAANERAENSLTSKRVSEFNKTIKPQRDRAPIVDQALVTLRDAADETDPAKQRTLYTSAIVNFIQAADQKAQVRWQLLNFFKSNVDPSIAGRWDVLKTRLLEGTMPQYTLQGMIKHLENLKALTASEIESQRAAWVKRHPSLDTELPDATEFFPSGVNAPDAGLTMSRATFNALTPDERKEAVAAGYKVR